MKKFLYATTVAAALFAAAVALAHGAEAQVTAPTVITRMTPLDIYDIPFGGTVDYSNTYIKAGAVMPVLVNIHGSRTTTNSVTTNTNCHIKFGMIDGMYLAATALQISETTDCIIEIGAVWSGYANNVYLTGGNYADFNNIITIGSIANTYGNNMLIQTPGDSPIYNVQGNHIRIGQIANAGQAGISVFPGAVANRFDVGPVEHNGTFGCYDGSGAFGTMFNLWRSTGTNSNGLAGGPC